MSSSRHLTSGVVLAGMLFLLLARPAARPATPLLVSTWRHAPLSIDGSATDWTKLEQVPGGPAMAAQNDADSLYLAVATSEPTLRQQLATGLVVWCDSTSKKARNTGLRLPGMIRRPLPGAVPDDPNEEALSRGSSGRPLLQFDWLGPGKGQRRLVDLTPGLGVEAASGTQEGVLVFEVRVPLHASTEHPYAFEAEVGTTIALGVETPSEPPMREGRGGEPGSRGGGGGMGGARGRGGPGGGMGGPAGGMPPPGGQRGGVPDAQAVKPMKLLWVNVTLARAR